MRIMIACRAIDNMAGGVERQAIALANAMVERGHEVSLLTLDLPMAEAFYDISPSVGWYKLGIGNPKLKASWSMRFSRMKKVRDIVEEFGPDVILAFQQGMFLTLRLYTMCMKVPVVAAERESPYRYDFIREGKHRNFIFQTFRLAPHITVQCESYIEAYPRYLRSKIAVIPNSVFPASHYAASAGQVGKEKILLCVGRLGYQKNQLVLLAAFAELAQDFSDWNLVLAGEGEGQEAIEKAIKDLGLSGRVRLLGAVKDVSGLYADAHALCIPSRWEGFPNVLGEALAHGLPAVGFEGCGGVRDLINQDENGLLAQGNDNAKTLREALFVIMQNDEKRQVMGKNAIRSVQQYVPEKIYSQWEEFLKKAHLS